MIIICAFVFVTYLNIIDNIIIVFIYVIEVSTACSNEILLII